MSLLLPVLSLAACSGVSDLDPATQVQLAIAIASILTETGQPVNPQNVSGSINVRLTATLPPGGTATVRASIGSVVCSRDLTSPPLFAKALATTLATVDASAAADVQQIECQLNTAAFNSTTGLADVLNGERALTAEVFFRPQGAAAGTQTQQAAISQQLTITNQSGFFATVTNTPTTAQAAVNPTGLSTYNGLNWRGGTVRVQVVPVLYSPATGLVVTRATVNLTGTGVSVIGTDNTPADGFTVTFPGDRVPPDGVADVSATDIRINVTTITASGVAGPGGVLPTTYAIDNLAPDGGPLAFPVWINGATNLTQIVKPDFTLDPVYFPSPPAPKPDYGVNSTSFDLFASVAGSENTVTRVEDLQQTSNTNAYRMAVELTDALGNRRKTVATNTSGVDYTPPDNFRIATGPNIVLDRAINPSAGSSFGVTTPTDAHSGFAGIRATVIGQSPSGTTCLYGNVNPATNACEPRLSGNTSIPFASPVTGARYATGIATAVDRAGNETEPVTVTVLNDLTPPTASQVHATTGGPFGGGPFNVQINATDDLDLNQATVIQCFDFLGTPGCVPVLAPVALGAWGPAAFTTSASRNVTILNVIKSAERTAPSGAPEGVAHPVVGVATRVTNQARLASTATLSYPPGLFASPGPSFSTLGAQRLQITTAGTSVGNGAPGAPACPAGVSTSLPISIKVAGTGPFPDPFRTVTVYFLDQGVASVINVDVPDVAPPTTVGGLVEHENVMAWTPTGVPAQTTNVTGFGVAPNGAAWLSRSTPVNILNCG